MPTNSDFIQEYLYIEQISNEDFLKIKEKEDNQDSKDEDSERGVIIIDIL